MKAAKMCKGSVSASRRIRLLFKKQCWAVRIACGPTTVAEQCPTSSLNLSPLSRSNTASRCVVACCCSTAVLVAAATVGEDTGTEEESPSESMRTKINFCNMVTCSAWLLYKALAYATQIGRAHV